MSEVQFRTLSLTDVPAATRTRGGRTSPELQAIRRLEEGNAVAFECPEGTEFEKFASGIRARTNNLPFRASVSARENENTVYVMREEGSAWATDENGQPVYIQRTNAEGEPLTNKAGEPRMRRLTESEVQ